VERYLLDTNVISELRKLRPHGGVVEWLNHNCEEQLFISAVLIGEVQAGIELTRRQDATKAREIEEWLNHIEDSYQTLPMNIACFREWGRLRIQKPASILEDAMIAATARIHGLTVATRNVRDFKEFDIQISDPFRA
jgi:hypothetical protein